MEAKVYDIQTKQPKAATNYTTSSNFEDFVQTLVDANKSPLTIRQYRSSWKRFVDWFESEFPTEDPTEATQKDIADFKRWMIDEGKSPNTQRQTLTQLKKVFAYLSQNNGIKDNPVQRIDAVKTAKTAPKWLDRKEQNALIRKVNKYGNIREKSILDLMRLAGLRVQELVDLVIDDISISERKGEVVVRKGKHERRRTVPLNKDIRRTLSEYIAEFRDGASGDAPLFVSTSNRSKGKPISSRAVQQLIEKYRDLTGIEKLNCHSLRHSFGHDLVQQNVSLDRVAELLGHMKQNGQPNIEMTLIYTRASKEDLQSEVEKLSWT